MKSCLKQLNKIDYLILTFMLLSRVILLTYVYPEKEKMFNGDSWHYEGLAIEFLTKGDYNYPPAGEFSDMIRPPGYPIFIMMNYLIFGTGNFLFPILWNLPAIFFLYLGIKRILQKIRNNPHYFLFLILAFDMAWLLYSKELVTEPIFTSIFVWSIVFLFNGLESKQIKHFILSSSLLAICALIKPIVLYLPVFLSIFLLLYLKKVKIPLIYLIIFSIGISPWVLRNKIVHHTFSFTSIKNNNLVFGHCAFLYADLYNITHREAQQQLDVELREKFPHSVDLKNVPYVVLNQAKASLAKEILLAHPFLYAKALIRGAFITLFDPGRIVFNRTFPSEQVGPIGLTNTIAKIGIVGTLRLLVQKDTTMVISLLSYLVFLTIVNGIALIGIPRFWKNDKTGFTLLSLISLYLLVLGGPIGNARFRLYIFPFLLIYVNHGILVIQHFFHKSRRLNPIKNDIQ